MANKNITSKNASMLYFDIESLNNVFTLCAYAEHPKNTLYIFYLIEDQCELSNQFYKNMNQDDRNDYLYLTVSNRIVESNPTFSSRIKSGEKANILFYDLNKIESNVILARLMGLSDADQVNNPNDKSVYTEFDPLFRITCDTDPDYDPTQYKHSYIAGYNSYNYDTTMLALYLQDAFDFIPNLKTYEQIIKDNKNNPNFSIYNFLKNKFIPTKPSTMRRHNDIMFSQHINRMPDYLSDVEGSTIKGYKSIPNKIRRNMLLSGRYLDIAKFNEKQQRVGLKRLLGMLGYQILESEKLNSHNATINNLNEFSELLAYNVSDVVELGELFKHKTYSSGFDTKIVLLNKYPEAIYKELGNTGKPNISQTTVRNNRLTPDSTSARFVTTVLAPYKPLKDIETVSYLYPSKEVAERLNIKQQNVLESAKEFFYENITDENARRTFDEVYKYYKDIEGKNFNESEEYKNIYAENGELEERLQPQKLNEIEKRKITIPYFKKDGTPTSCFVNFSTGGIHGSELYIEKYNKQMADYYHEKQLITEAQAIFPNAVDLRKNKGFMSKEHGFIDYKQVLLGGRTINNSEYKNLDDKRPNLITINKSGYSTTSTAYKYTTVAHTIHEDFSSYYPNMLRNMKAFDNPILGEDRYADLLADKDKYHKAMHDKNISDDEKQRLNILRNAIKLLLNSASGAGDTLYDTNLRMNNNIISMRIIGQIGTWRIGQAQTFAGALIPSTNTDGLYSILDAETNNRVLEEQQKSINIEIEPEPILLVSKDSNNRLELMKTEGDTEEYKIVNASGGTLACYKEPNPTQSLAHPAMIDYILAYYLKAIAEKKIPKYKNTPIRIDEPFDREYAYQIIKDAFSIKLPKTLTKKLKEETKYKYDTIEKYNHDKLKEHYIWLIKQFQTVIAASIGSLTFPIASDPIKSTNFLINNSVIDTTNPDNLNNLRNLQHYNRIFVTIPGTCSDAVSIQAMGCYKVAPATINKRKDKNDKLAIMGHPKLIKLMEELGYTRDDSTDSNLQLLPEDEDLVIRKVSGIEPTWHMRIENRNLYHMSIEELENILSTLDIETYITMAEKSFTKNWMNDKSWDVPKNQ